MWIVVPLIYFMSWRSVRRFDQAFSETAAWVVGYLATAAAIMALNLGNIHVIEARPDGIGTFVAMAGGFSGMIVSRWLWKRRGGHLEPRKQIPWMRITGHAYKAARSTFAGETGSKNRAAGAKPAASTARPSKTAPGGPAPTRPAATAARPAAAATKPIVTSSDVQKVMSNKWVRGSIRGLSAALSDPKAKKPPRR